MYEKKLMSRVSIVVLALFLAGTAWSFEILIDDDFNDGDLATGGINGGFMLSINDPQGIDSNAVEVGSIAVVSPNGAATANAGIVSIASVDPLSEAALAEGLTVKWDVNSISQTTLYNGNTYVLQTEPNFFNAVPHIALAFNGKWGTSPDGVGLYYDDKNGSSGLLSGIQNYENASWLDGFTCEFTISEMGWAYEVTGLNAPGDPNDPNDEGVPTVISDSGTWADANLPETFLTDLLDNDCHVSAHGQGSGTVLQYNYCTVSIGQEPTVAWNLDMSTDPVPDPMQVRDGKGGNYVMNGEGQMQVTGECYLDPLVRDYDIAYDMTVHFVVKSESAEPIRIWSPIASSADGNYCLVGPYVSLNADGTQHVEISDGGYYWVSPYEPLILTGFAADAYVDITLECYYETDTLTYTVTDGIKVETGTHPYSSTGAGGNGSGWTLFMNDGAAGLIDQISMIIHDTGVHAN